MYELKECRDAEDLKWKAASDPKIIRVLATFAHALGFGWCFGTRSQTVGEDFDVRKDGDSYILQARYNSKDPYPDGNRPDDRLRITLSNFQIGFDPGTFEYGTPDIKDLQPLAIYNDVVRNKGNQEDNFSTVSTSQLSETVTHTTNVSFTEGIKVSAKGDVQIPFIGKGEVTTEFSLSSTQGWSNSSATTEGQEHTATYTCSLPPRSQRPIQLIAYRVNSDVVYSALARVGFDIKFKGFLRRAGNARADHPDDGPSIELPFGNATHSGFEDIWDKWTHRDIPGYWKDWDWDWMLRQDFHGYLEWAMRFIGEGVGAKTSGKFNNVKGIATHIIAGESQPITEEAATTELAKAGEVAHGPTRAAMHPNADEIPGVRVIKVESWQASSKGRSG